MKAIITIILLSSFNIFANEQKLLIIKNSKIEDIKTRSGYYSRVIDVQEKIDQLLGVQSNSLETLINLQNTEVESIQFTNGKILEIHARGGDMGGGGTTN